MPITISNLTSGSDVDGDDIATTSSISPGANKLILLSVTDSISTGTEPSDPIITGNGITWELINSIYWDTSSSSRKKTWLYRGMNSSPSTGSITIDFNGVNQTGVSWSVDEVSGMDTSGINGSGAIVQSATNKDESVTSSYFSITLSTFSDSNNATFGLFSEGDESHSITPGSGFTELAEPSLSYPKIQTEYKSTNDTVVDWTSSGSVQAGGIAIEIKIAPSASAIHSLLLLGAG